MRQAERVLRFLVIFAMSISALAAFGAEKPKTSCETCHADSSMFDQDHLAIVTGTTKGVHAQVGLSCHDCHGGNPDPALSDDMSAAMDENFGPHPYVGAPERKDIPQFCGRCHSDTNFMRRYNPAPRVDQVQEYWTSQHGKGLTQGDPNVATCIDCHGVHGIRRTTDPESRVYPTRVAETCGSCHADPSRMQGYKDDYGDPLPVDQVARWKQSVHANALLVRGDLSAPTCNDCHGNHGARPPGVDSVVYVCGQCHGREAELFSKSPKFEGFSQHNEFLAGGGECSSCHEGIPPAINDSLHHFSECVVCHNNHAVIRPTVAMFGNLPDVPCAFCHEPQGNLGAVEPVASAEHYKELRDQLLSLADKQGLKGDQRFDWMVEQALKLPTHTVAGSESGSRELRPEFSRLFEKFRIGKTHYSYLDPATGKNVSLKVRQCTDCHHDADSSGLAVAKGQLSELRQLSGMMARSERILLAARRGGVEVRDAVSDLDAAIDSQISLEVLVHTFAIDGQFLAKRKEGTQQATAALVAGQKALSELSYRRGGLFAALAIIVLVLVALGLKIRSLSSRD